MIRVGGAQPLNTIVSVKALADKPPVAPVAVAAVAVAPASLRARLCLGLCVLVCWAVPIAQGADWVELGPAPIRSGPFAGRASAVVASPTNSNKYYVAGADGGVWRTLDGGQSWTPLTDDLPITAMGALALDPNDDNVIYAGSGEANYANHSVYGLGLYKSTDGGDSWQVLAADTFAGRTFSRLAISPTDSNVLFAAIGHAGGFPARVAGKGHPLVNGPVGIFRSIDAGVTWSHLTGDLPNVAGTDVVFDPTDGERVFVAIGDIFGDAGNGIYRSSDGGDTFTKLAGGLPTGTIGRVSLAIAPTDPNRLYTIITNPSNSRGGGATTRGVFRSDDGGETWTDTRSGNFQATFGWYLSTAIVGPTNPDILFVGGQILLRSTNGGGNYANRTAPHVDNHGLAFDASGRLLCANDGGLHRSNNLGDSWQALNEGLGLVQFYAGLSVHPTLRDFVLAGFQDNGTCIRQEGGDWRSKVGGDGGYTALNPFNANVMLAEFQGTGNLFRSTNGGSSFSGSGSGISRGDRNVFLPPFTFDPTVPKRMLYATHRIYQSTNGGASWSAISSDLTGGAPAAIRALVFAPSNSQTVYAATNDGRVLVSTDSGFNWDLKLTDHFGWPRVTRELAVDPLDDRDAYLAVAWFGVDQVLETTDRGDTWHSIDGDLPDDPVNTVAVFNDGAQKFIFAGTDMGVFITDNGGSQWKTLGNNMPHSPVIDLVVDPAQGRLIAATQGRGVWHIPLPVVACDLLNKLKVKCNSRSKLKAIVKSNWVEGTTIDLTNNGGDTKRMTIKANGKGKAKWKNQAGSHEVCITQCGTCETADCN